MADNVTLPGTGSPIASDEIGGAQYQRVKLNLGADGATQDIAPGQQLMAASVPVAIASNQSALAVTAAALPLPAGAATSALQGGGLPAALGAGGGVKVDGSGAALPVSAAALPLPAGAATQATLATLATEATVATLATQATLAAAETHLGDIETAVEILDNAIAGTEMQVDVVTIAAGETHLGEIGVSCNQLDVNLTVDTNVYHANDVFAATQEMANMARVNGGCIELMSVTALDPDNNAAADINLWFLDSNVVFGAENAAVSISDADALHIVGNVTLPSASWLSLVASRCACVRIVPLLMKAAAGTTSLWIAATCAGTPTMAGAVMPIKIQYKRW